MFRYIVLVSVLCFTNCVEVHFEAADSGFFLKHLRHPPVTPEISNLHFSSVPPVKAHSTYDSVLSVDRFTIIETTQPVSIRASYGPFSTKQTVPARYIVPDILENQNDYLNYSTASLLELQQPNMHLDISAHLVRQNVPQDSPVLRVLFHAGADPGGHLQRQKVCVLLHVSLGSLPPLKGRCMPEGEDGVCVAEVVIPFNWWPSLPPPNWSNIPVAQLKVPQRFVQVSFSVFEPPFRNPEQCEPKIQIQPLTTFAQVPLSPATSPYKELRSDEFLTFLLPQLPLFPLSKIHVPVFLNQTTDQHIAAFTVRARVKSGIKILGATASSDLWNISIEKENPKHTTARVTVFRKSQKSKASPVGAKNNSAEVTEIFSWLLEAVEDTNEVVDSGKIVWSATYIFDNSKDKETPEVLTGNETKTRLIAKLEINKDDIQAVLPMAKIWELMNTAVLTGRQIAQAMKVFIVSQAGRVADVTLQSSCHAEDESVIKVSSSCSSVYVDGSEIRGSSNASVIVKYGTYIGVAKFIVWMPEFPLEVYVADFRLSQIKGWKVLEDNNFVHNKQQLKRKRRSYIWTQHGASYHNNMSVDKMICRARYQQSPVEVYAKFLAIDQNSGRISYFISRKTGLRITDLVQSQLRVADPKIASLKGRKLQGKSMGRTDVQVLSPITGRVIGTKEIRVGSDKVNLSKLIVRVISGLQLTITPDNTIENGYLAETSVTHKLTAQYQEGLLDIDLEFSDGSRTPLRDVFIDDYFLLVESLDTEVVAFAPMLASHHPRVIAVGEGNGNLLKIALLLSEECRLRRNTLSAKQNKSNIAPLATALASIEVDFNNVESASKQEAIQNDGTLSRDRKMYHNRGDLGDIIVGIPLRDVTQHYQSSAQNRQHRSSVQIINKSQYPKKVGKQKNLTSMEIGMYVLLTAFCFAIIVFVISCVVYAAKFRPIIIETDLDPLEQTNSLNITFNDRRLKETTTNAHDWVWLGRSTVERNSIVSDFKSSTSTAKVGNMSQCDARMRITNNPNFSYENDIIKNNMRKSSFDHVKSPTQIISSPYFQTDTEQSAKNDLFGCIEIASSDYKPPVPPHRNIGTRSVITIPDHNASVENSHNFEEQIGLHEYSQGKNNNSERHSHVTKNDMFIPCNMNVKTVFQPKTINDSQSSHILHREEHKQVLSEPALECVPSISQLNNTTIHERMHNAEKLVECVNPHQKNAFQFDSLTSNKIRTDFLSPSLKVEKSKIQKSNDFSKEEVVRFPSSLGKTIAKSSSVKRATIVGNPMFSAASDGMPPPDESLGLDDLDMDYEQIMTYFDNLKESNA